VRAGAVEAAADDEGRVEAALGEDARDQARGGGLAVRAGHGDALLEAHQLGQHQGARHHRDLAGARRDHFRVVAPDSGGHHHRVGRGDVLGAVADVDARAEPARRRVAAFSARSEPLTS
jgi:hypothetical protein